MPEILIHAKIIQNFTTDRTKIFNFFYNSELLKASIEEILITKDIKDLNSKKPGKDILNISTQRYSNRLSNNNLLNI